MLPLTAHSAGFDSFPLGMLEFNSGCHPELQKDLIKDEMSEQDFRSKIKKLEADKKYCEAGLHWLAFEMQHPISTIVKNNRHRAIENFYKGEHHEAVVYESWNFLTWPCSITGINSCQPNVSKWSQQRKSQAIKVYRWLILGSYGHLTTSNLYEIKVAAYLGLAKQPTNPWSIAHQNQAKEIKDFLAKTGGFLSNFPESEFIEEIENKRLEVLRATGISELSKAEFHIQIARDYKAGKWKEHYILDHLFSSKEEKIENSRRHFRAAISYLVNLYAVPLSEFRADKYAWDQERKAGFKLMTEALRGLNQDLTKSKVCLRINSVQKIIEGLNGLQKLNQASKSKVSNDLEKDLTFIYSKFAESHVCRAQVLLADSKKSHIGLSKQYELAKFSYDTFALVLTLPELSGHGEDRMTEQMAMLGLTQAAHYLSQTKGAKALGQDKEFNSRAQEFRGEFFKHFANSPLASEFNKLK